MFLHLQVKENASETDFLFKKSKKRSEEERRVHLGVHFRTLPLRTVIICKKVESSDEAFLVQSYFSQLI